MIKLIKNSAIGSCLISTAFMIPITLSADGINKIRTFVLGDLLFTAIGTIGWIGVVFLISAAERWCE